MRHKKRLFLVITKVLMFSISSYANNTSGTNESIMKEMGNNMLSSIVDSG